MVCHLEVGLLERAQQASDMPAQTAQELREHSLLNIAITLPPSIASEMRAKALARGGPRYLFVKTDGCGANGQTDIVPVSRIDQLLGNFSSRVTGRRANASGRFFDARHIAVQEYVDRPLLLKPLDAPWLQALSIADEAGGRKHSLRLYVLVVSLDPLVAYVDPVAAERVAAAAAAAKAAAAAAEAAAAAAAAA